MELVGGNGGSAEEPKKPAEEPKKVPPPALQHALMRALRENSLARDEFGQPLAWDEILGHIELFRIEAQGLYVRQIAEENRQRRADQALRQVVNNDLRKRAEG